MYFSNSDILGSDVLCPPQPPTHTQTRQKGTYALWDMFLTLS